MDVKKNRTQAFVLASTDHGSMIVNRFDYKSVEGGSHFFGVGAQLMHKGCFDPEEVKLALTMLDARRQRFGDGVVAIDCGANIGVHTIEWAKKMHSWGHVYSFEAQERLYYALAGNIAINNCFNATAYNRALGDSVSVIEVPEVNYLIPSSFGSLELKQSDDSEDIGQPINRKRAKEVSMISVDSLNLKRLDFLKIDVEGMEADVLRGARGVISQQRPSMIVEYYKSEKEKIIEFFMEFEYKWAEMGFNFVAIHKDDPLSNSGEFSDFV